MWCWVVLVLLAITSCCSAWQGEENSKFSSSERVALQGVNVATATLSLCGSFFIVCCVVIFKKWDIFHFKLVAMLSLSDMMLSLTGMGNPIDGSVLWPEPSLGCTLQAVLRQFSLSMSMGWAVAIAYTLYLTIVVVPVDDDHHIRFRNYSIAITLYSAATAALPFTANSYGDAGPYCWIAGTDTGKIFRLVSFYIPIWIAMASISYMYYLIITTLKLLIDDANDDSHAKRLVAVVRRLMAYPAIMFLCWVFPTINRIQNAADEAHPSFPLYILMWIFMNLNGAANACVYGMNDNMQREFRKCCGLGAGHSSQ